MDVWGDEEVNELIQNLELLHDINDIIQPKRGTIMSTWEWLNGKKTTIGAACLLLAGILTRLDITGLAGAIDALEYVGMVFSGVGIGHKVTKHK